MINFGEGSAESFEGISTMPIYQFEKLSDFKLPFVPDLFIVASYGKIIPQSVLDLPKYGTLNIHPSILPKYRGATPLQTAILNDDKNTGVTIIKMDEKMDHGDIVAVKKIDFTEANWPPTFSAMEYIMSVHGANLLLENLESYLEGTIKLKKQDHTLATFTKKINKADGEIVIDQANDTNAWQNYLKICAYEGWPGTYFFITKTDGTKIRVSIKSARFEDGKLIIERVTPEGSREMDYKDFLRGL